jgi:hypothetical protein
MAQRTLWHPEADTPFCVQLVYVERALLPACIQRPDLAGRKSLQLCVATVGPAPDSGSAFDASSPSHTLQNRGRKLQHADSRIFVGFHADGNPVCLRKRIGNYFKILTIEPDTAGCPVSKILHVCANLGN